MTSRRWACRVFALVGIAGGFAVPGWQPAAVGEPVVVRQQSSSSAVVPQAVPAKATPQLVDWFAAVEKKQISVRVLARDEKQVRVFVTNRSTQPLTVRLPESFVGRPVVAQFRGFPLPNGQNPQNLQQQPQAFAMGVKALGGNPGQFNLAPEQTRDFKVAAVCLEHGKPTPRPRHEYELIELSKYSTDPALALVLRQLGSGEISQSVAQAAAWHLASDRSWEQLAAEPGAMISASTHEPRFTKRELKQAEELVRNVRSQATDKRPSGTTSTTTSSVSDR